MNKLLETILTTKRAHNSTGELNFLKWLHDTLKDMGCKPEAMAEGCIVVSNKPNKVLFSCHVDTVHSTALSDGSFQPLTIDPAMGHVFLGDPKSGCLGADDGAGIYVLLRMLAADVPGTYIFHRGEERGGIGANAMLAKHRDWLKKFNQCVAFDRANKDDIIITQGGASCASVAYGVSLSAALAAQGLEYKNSNNGSFTDSKVYRSVIAECINLSVGYQDQHGPGEYLDYEHLELLVLAAIRIEWSKLAVTRKPVEEQKSLFNNSKYLKDYEEYSVGIKPKFKSVPVPPPAPVKVSAYDSEDLEHMNYEEIFDWTGDESVTEAICNMMVAKAEAEARAEMYQQLAGL
jgi:hypothetical protein